MFPLSLAGCARLKRLAASDRLQLLFVSQHTARPFKSPAHAEAALANTCELDEEHGLKEKTKKEGEREREKRV